MGGEGMKRTGSASERRGNAEGMELTNLFHT